MPPHDKSPGNMPQPAHAAAARPNCQIAWPEQRAVSARRAAHWRISMALFFVFFALGPALCGFSAAYLLRYPVEWPAPAAVFAVSLQLTLLTQTWGGRRLSRLVSPQHRPILSALRWSGLTMGVVAYLMTYFVLLAQ
jgi:hypothetical protein